ncbi:hypothetical protein [Stenotrophomonas maltophilia]|uniref:hypothetical protein n=1 Tax=Stenotrophomonas maltophilia TaxID=40324 RepID=UPI000C1555BF|nr:hypothetical protein [Stenotrophomonas maltophilia]
MSNDKTTLADVQPGGRVRLGNVLPPLPRTHYNACGDGSEPLYTPEQMHDYARAALSAQPSRGGQDALDCIGRIEEAIEFRVPHDIYAAVHGDLAELKAALAARQPVGAVPSIDYEDLVDQAKDLFQCGCSVNGAFDWLLEQLTDSEAPAAPPAQAVDLGPVRGLAEKLMRIGSEDARFCAGELLALIDSQAVGNG